MALDAQERSSGRRGNRVSGEVCSASRSTPVSSGMTGREDESLSCNGDMTVAKGMIRRLLEHRGFGLIQCEDGRKVFFHRSEVLQVPFSKLREGQVVEFAVQETPQGPKARRVRVITIAARTTPLRPNA